MSDSNELGVNRWWSAPKDMVAGQVVAVCRELDVERQQRKLKWDMHEAAYNGKCGAPSSDYDIDGSPMNAIRRLVDTLVARIAAEQRPKASFLSSGGTYKTRLECRKLSKFAEAQLHVPQGQFETSWDLGDQVFKDACIGGTGVIKVYADINLKRITHERCFAHELMVDETDAKYGDPKNLFHSYTFDRHTLLNAFPKHRDAIERAPYSDDLEELTSSSWRSDTIRLYEAWRLPFGYKNGALVPGRHVICLDAGIADDGACLVDEPWSRTSFPFLFGRWKRGLEGFWGQSFVEEVLPMQKHLDEMFGFLAENAQLQSSGKIFYVPGAIRNMAALKGNGAWDLVPVENINAVKYETPPPFHPALVQWMQLLQSAVHEMSGVSQTSSQGRKEPGLESGVALRTMSHQQSGLFLPQSRAYEALFRELARKDVECASDLKAAGHKLSLVLPDEGFLGTIDFDEITLPSDMYSVQIHTSNSMENSLAGRRQQIMEMGQAKAIDADDMQRLLLSANPDLEKAQRNRNAQFEYMERVIADFQEHDPASGKAVVPTPDPLLDLNLAIEQMRLGYLEMLEMGAGEENLRLARNWIDMARKVLEKSAAPPAQGPQPGGMPPGMGPPGMPPPGMGPPGPPQPSPMPPQVAAMQQ